MARTAYLKLANGMLFKGEYFGAEGEVTGEVVFTTAMTGYLANNNRSELLRANRHPVFSLDWKLRCHSVRF